jgi:putative endonuclease
MTNYCYILYSQKLNKYYVGSTSDIERRLDEHNRGKEKFTRTGMPWVLVFKEAFESLQNARRREQYIKRQKSRKYIENLISSEG